MNKWKRRYYDSLIDFSLVIETLCTDYKEIQDELFTERQKTKEFKKRILDENRDLLAQQQANVELINKLKTEIFLPNENEQELEKGNAALLTNTLMAESNKKLISLLVEKNKTLFQLETDLRELKAIGNSEIRKNKLNK
jgi:hypothetical protein